MGSGASSVSIAKRTQELAVVDKNQGHHTQTSHWTSAKENWEASNDHGLPYAQEHAVDESNRTYYINHQDQTTQREEPSPEEADESPPEPRDYELTRETQMGFGFVAGSEKPVVVRFVTEGGPSDGKLMPDDRILQINGENVEKCPREHVIELVRSCNQTMVVTVCQPYSENSGRKSALLTAAKKARLKNNPSRVRFADAVTLNGSTVISPSSHESYIPFMPNVLKVFLENGQTKSFKYDSKTCVKDVMENLQEKLSLLCIEHFSLVLQNIKSPSQGKMTFLQDHQGLAEIAARPGSQHLKCLFRLTFVPRDSYNLVQKDPNSFEYFYMQCTNDVLLERFSSELKCDISLRLAALQIQEHCLANNMGKASLKVIEKETGLDKFVPESILDNMKLKDIRKMLNHYLKVNQNLALPGQKSMTLLQSKMHYLKILSEIRSFGGKCFLVTLVEKNAEVMISVGPRQGISLVTNIKNNTLAPLADFDHIDHMIVKDEERQTVKRVVLHMKEGDLKVMSFVMLAEETVDFLCLVEGYYKVYVDKDRCLLEDDSQKVQHTQEAPPYNGEHHVTPASWSYIDSQTGRSDHPETEDEGNQVDEADVSPRQRRIKVIDLSRGPPNYKEVVGTTEAQDKKKFMLEVENHSSHANSKPKAPLASPDYSTLSNSSESPDNQQNAPDPRKPVKELENVATDSHRVTNGHIENEEESEDFLSDDFGSTLESSFGDNFLKDSIAVATDRINKEKLNNNDIDTNDELYTEGGTIQEEFHTRQNGVSDISAEEDPVHEVKGRDSLELANLTKTQRGESISSGETTEEGSTDTGSTIVQREKSGSKRGAETKPDVDGKSPENGERENTETYQVVMRPKSTGTPRKERPGSFGLHSPDKVPQTAAELQHLTEQYQQVKKVDRTSSSSDVHPSYNPKLFCDGGLYLDPDIIDLTFLPPPLKDSDGDEDDTSTAEDADTAETLMDFSSPEMACPPPGFGDRSARASLNLDTTKLHDTSMESGSGSEASLPTYLTDLPPTIMSRLDDIVAHDMELGTQMSAMDALLLDDMLRDEAEKESGIESESDDTEFNAYNAKTPTSPSEVVRRRKKKTTTAASMNTNEVFSQLAKRQSFQHVDFGADDIDAFIASVTVPPPPRDDPEGFSCPSLQDPPKPKLSLTTDRSSSMRRALQFGNSTEKSTLGGGSSKLIKTAPLKASEKTIEVNDSAEDGGLDRWFAQHGMDMAHLDQDIAKLITPAPLSESIELEVCDIPIVPPVKPPNSSPQKHKEYTSPPPLSEKPKVSPTQTSDTYFGNSPRKTQNVPNERLQKQDKPSQMEETVQNNIPKRIISTNGVRSTEQITPGNSKSLSSAEGSPDHSVKPRTVLVASKVSQVKQRLEGVVGTGSEQSVRSDIGKVHSITGQMSQRSVSHDPRNPTSFKTDTGIKRETFKSIKGSLVQQLSATIQEKSSFAVGEPTTPKKSDFRAKHVDDGTASPKAVVVMREKQRESSISPRPRRRQIGSESGSERSSGSPNSPRRGRPVEAPPPPPSASDGLPYKRSVSTPDAVNHLYQKRKVPPPAPPKRFSSLDGSAPPPTNTNSLPATTGKTVILIPKHSIHSTSSVNSRGLQQTTFGGRSEDDGGSVSKSLDHAPLHMPVRVVHSVGTMPHFRKKPPQPPPRRSSTLGNQYNEMPELSRSSEYIVQDRPKFSTFGPSMGKDVLGGSRSQYNSENSIFTMFKGKSASSPQGREQDADLTNKQAGHLKSSPGKLPVNKTESDSSHFNKSAVNHTNPDTTRLTRKDSDSSDSISGSPKAGRAKTYVSPSIQAKQNAIATALHRQSSLGGELSEDFASKTLPASCKQTNTPPRSPSVGRSSTFSKSSTLPKPYVSPQSSPALHRHSSFSKAADKNPAPFKTFLGDSVEGTAGNSSGGVHGSNVERTASNIMYGAQIQTKDNGIKSVPMKIVRPMVSSPVHNNTTTVSSPSSPRSTTVNGDPHATIRTQHHTNSSPQRRSREGSTSSQDSIPLSAPHSPRNSAGSAMAARMSPRSAEMNKITSQRRFFPARKAPAAPMPVSAPEAPSAKVDAAEDADDPSKTSTSMQSFGTFSRTNGDSLAEKHGGAMSKGRYSNHSQISAELENRLSSNSLKSPQRGSVGTGNSTDYRSSTAEKGQGYPRNGGVSHSSQNGNAGTRKLSTEALQQTFNETRTKSPPSTQQRGRNNNDAMTSSAIDATHYTITQHSHQCDIPDEIIAKHYEGPRTFTQASLDVDALRQYLDRSISNLVHLDENAPDFKANKDLLVGESRQFVTDSKLLVSSATQNLEKVVQNVNSSIKTLAKIIYHCSRTMKALASVSKASDLGSKVREVALAYKCTVESAHMAAGKPLSDPHMKSLMKQATGLAAILSVLMKALKSLDNR